MLQTGAGANTYQDRGALQHTAGSTLNPYFLNTVHQRCKEYLRMFDTSWEVQKIITIPVDDALKYRAELKGISDGDAHKIWDYYDGLNLDNQNRRALVQERLFGGSAQFGVFKTEQESANTEWLGERLPLEAIRPKDFEAVNVIDITQISQAKIEFNPFSSGYDRQPDYMIASVPVDCSRLIVLDGNPVVGRHTRGTLEGGRAGNIGFGNSKITTLYDILKYTTGTQEGAYHLINMASCLILEVEKLRSMIAANSSAIDALEKLIESLSIYRAAIIDGKGVNVNQHAANFGSVPELMMMYMQFLSAASDIPATRFLGQAPGGLNATGESDLQNYYDGVRGNIQVGKLKPMQRRQVDWIGCSIWGYPVWKVKRQNLEIEYPPLWNESAKEKADRLAIHVASIKSLLDSGAIGAEAAIAELKARDAFLTDMQAEKAISDPIEMEPSPIDPAGKIGALRGARSPLAGKISLNADDFDESKHKRDDGGKFTSGDGGANKVDEQSKPSKSADKESVEKSVQQGKAAIEKVLATKSDVINAMHREDVGDISFFWGEPGDPSRKYKGGFGVSHILEKHGDSVLKKMPEVIARGEKVKEDGPDFGTRVHINYEGHTAILSLYRDRKRETWLLTGWDDE